MCTVHLVATMTTDKSSQQIRKQQNSAHTTRDRLNEIVHYYVCDQVFALCSGTAARIYIKTTAQSAPENENNIGHNKYQMNEKMQHNKGRSSATSTIQSQ